MKQNETKSREADIVVIGGGGAGLPAALTALEQGAGKVVILEKRSVAGGSANLAMGLFACESDLQKKANLGMSKDDLFKKTMDWHHFDKIDPKILRAYINKSADTIRWLEKQGLEFEVFPLMYGWHLVKGQLRLGGFKHAMKVLAERCKDRGGEVFLNTGARKVLRRPGGGVTGVLAAAVDEEIEIKCKSVIIATGGFVGNRELLKKYFPYYDDSFSTDAVLHTGDGIRLAADAGAAMENYTTLIRESCYSFKTKQDAPNRVSWEPYSVWVNKKGERFLDEAGGMLHNATYTNALIRQPGKVGYALFDEKMVKGIEENGFMCSVAAEFAAKPQLVFRKKLLDEAAKKIWVKISDTWDGIADWIGAKPEVLRASIDEYNSFCDRGYDETCVKDPNFLRPLRNPPYYAIRYRLLMIDTVGPVRVNHHMEVLDAQDNCPIPGLYGAGVIASGWVSNDGLEEGYFPAFMGAPLGFAVNSGRIAGESAVKYLRQENEGR